MLHSVSCFILNNVYSQDYNQNFYTAFILKDLLFLLYVPFALLINFKPFQT